MRLLDNILATVAPHDCLGCGLEGALQCKACQEALKSPIARCYKCHKVARDFRTCLPCRRISSLYGVHPAVRYETIAKDIVWRLKFERARSASAEIARIMTPLLAQFQSSTTLLVCVPTATSRIRQRGYDQAELITRELSRRTGLPHARLLTRHGQHKQVGASREQRAAQLRQAFRPLKADKIRNAHIILIDDVITTGATLEAAAATLRAAGAKRVEAVVFAQA